MLLIPCTKYRLLLQIFSQCAANGFSRQVSQLGTETCNGALHGCTQRKEERDNKQGGQLNGVVTCAVALSLPQTLCLDLITRDPCVDVACGLIWFWISNLEGTCGYVLSARGARSRVLWVS